MCQITQIGGGELSSDNTGGRDEVKHNLFLSSCLCCVITDSSSPETAASEKPSLPFVSRNENDQTPETAVCSTSLT